MRSPLSLWTLSLWTGLLLTAIMSAQSAPAKAPATSPTDKVQSLPQFEDVAQKAGLTVPHISSPDKKYIVESMSGGVGLIDCDNDGRLDIITVNGSTVQRFRAGGDLMITLYHQDTGPKNTDLKNTDPKNTDPKNNEIHFTDITNSAGLTHKGWGMGVAVADYDNDGLHDIYVTGYGGNALYHNLGNCKFEDVTEKAGVARGRIQYRRRLGRLRSRRPRRSFCLALRARRYRQPAAVRQRSAFLPLQGSAGAVRPVGHARRIGFAVSQQRRRHLRRSFEESRAWTIRITITD